MKPEGTASDNDSDFFDRLNDLDVFFLQESANYDGADKGKPLLFRKKAYNIRNDEFRVNLMKWVKEKRTALKSRIKSQRANIRENLNDPNFVMTIDKISFVFGILIIMVTEAFLFLIPSQMPNLYTVLLLPLTSMRYYLYRKTKQHYYLYDFCYYQQILVLLQIHCYPQNLALFKINFALTNGPLAMAVVLWRNSLVFHSVDKMTSSMIHLLPSVVMFSIRWKEQLLHHQFPLWEEQSLNDSFSSYFWGFICYPLFCYFIWQCLYLLKTEVVSKQKLRNDTEIMTSFRYLQRKATNTNTYKIINTIFGPTHQLIGFISYQCVYTILTLLPIPIFWNSMRIHTLYLSVIFIQALINGSTYYFQIFASRYIEDLQRKVGKDLKGNSNGSNQD